MTRSLVQSQRESVGQQAAHQRAAAQAVRHSERQARELVRLAAANEREAKRLYAEGRAADVDDLNQDLSASLEELDSLLAAALTVDDFIDLDSLKAPPQLPVWSDGALEMPLPYPDPARFAPPAPSGLSKMFGKAKYDKAYEEGRFAYEAAVADWQAHEKARVEELQRRREVFDAALATAQSESAAQHQAIDHLKQDLAAGKPEAVVDYFELVLNASQYPSTFPKLFRLAYVPESRQLVAEYELPDLKAIPAVKAYKYIRSTDSSGSTPRPITQIRTQYASVVAQVTLRTVHEIFEADRAQHIDVVIFNGVLDTIDPANGKQIRPCLVTLRTTRDTFSELDLGRVEPLTCLKHLSASVSKSPAELVPVRPVLAFDMVDPRFVAESDALSLLDERPNLMELSPNEFESLIQNLFQKMGLDTKLTRASRDGGVDCVAYDPRPIFGGKVVIQAKRYKNTVGVSAVRDLFGTLQNEGASKGILVTTSGYGQASVDFAANKPIELLAGSNLLYLLREHAGIEAKIEPPEDWTDPLLDGVTDEVTVAGYTAGRIVNNDSCQPDNTIEVDVGSSTVQGLTFTVPGGP